MTATELVPAGVVDVGAVPGDGVRQHAETCALRWLHGYVNAETRNAYAIDIGLSAEVRAALPGGPRSPAPAAAWAWIPWARARGLDPAGELTVETFESWVHTLHKTTGSKSVRRRRWGALCAFYARLRRDGLVRCDPDDLLNRRTMGLSGSDPSATVALTVLQMRALFVGAEIATGPARDRHRAMLAVLAATGCRAKELVSLDLDDYQRPAGNGPALLRLDGKGEKQRWVKLPAADADVVDAYLPVRVQPGPAGTVAVVGQVSAGRTAAPLFTTVRGRRVHVDDVTAMLRRIARRPQLDDPKPQVRAAARELAPIRDTIRPHQLRHAYARTAEENGVPLSQIKQDLGHASLVTTQTYLHAREVAEHSGAQVVSDTYHAGVLDLQTQDPTRTDAAEE